MLERSTDPRDQRYPLQWLTVLIGVVGHEEVNARSLQNENFRQGVRIARLETDLARARTQAGLADTEANHQKTLRHCTLYSCARVEGQRANIVAAQAKLYERVLVAVADLSGRTLADALDDSGFCATVCARVDSERL